MLTSNVTEPPELIVAVNGVGQMVDVAAKQTCDAARSTNAIKHRTARRAPPKLAYFVDIFRFPQNAPPHGRWQPSWCLGLRGISARQASATRVARLLEQQVGHRVKQQMRHVCLVQQNRRLHVAQVVIK
ncbi:hypothetical protein J7373_08235 [Xanthomonas sp. A2111]|uniref:Uncharacterized protein n=1 Tax=Xanthomonas hawaiiensis TaxID=3003247 RepID=A0ABU2I587_9XANT|nr:hypothetical protein [Xanthomonas sp. A2111]MBO9828228.1 hypothetical protein [Xanthomonas sp. A2111]MDS9993280.1 hypothetical protein [Xanthomonas sp. A2111]